MMALCFVPIFKMRLFVKKWIFKILQVKILIYSQKQLSNRSFIDGQLDFMYALHFSACWEFCDYMGEKTH